MSLRKKLFFIVLAALTVYYVLAKVVFYSPQLAFHQGNYLLVLLYAHFLILFFLWLIVALLGGKSFCKGVDDFIIGDDGGYSLSRLQAVIWAVTIVSYQISVMLSLYLTGGFANLFYFQLDFSEPILWLLGLSLMSCITVKGITVNKLKNDPLFIRKQKPELIDIISGPNGLDFSKCQMLIWTLIAIVVFNLKVIEFIKVFDHPKRNFAEYFHHFYEENGNDTKNYDPTFPFVPYLSWTFVVLMGLSQGAYVGKKLVPQFKADEVQAQQSIAVQDAVNKLDIQIEFKQNLLKNVNPVSTVGIENKRLLELEITELKRQKALLQVQVSSPILVS